MLIGGPCLAESYDLCAKVCERLVEVCDVNGFQFIFKASFDKANRTSAQKSRGHGIDVGLEIFRRIKSTFGVPITTDVHSENQPTLVKDEVDLLQIPAFLCRQSDLLEAAAQTGLPVNVKKGQFLAPWDAHNIVEKLRTYGASGTMLTERGTSFGYNYLVVDMAGLQTMRTFGVPVCFDATHSAQRPGGLGDSSGGARESIPALTRAACSVGIDALFLEVHPNPEEALSDAQTQWPLDRIDELIKQAKRCWQTSV